MPSCRSREFGVSSGRGLDMISCVVTVAKIALCQRFSIWLGIFLTMRYRAVKRDSDSAQEGKPEARSMGRMA